MSNSSVAGIVIEATATTIATITDTMMARKSSEAVPCLKKGPPKEIGEKTSITIPAII